jgi:hypothetical protein
LFSLCASLKVELVIVILIFLFSVSISMFSAISRSSIMSFGMFCVR